MKNHSITYKIFSSIAILSILGIAACSTSSQSVVTIPTEVVGEAYQPQFLTQEGYELIISASIETGNQEYSNGNR